MAGKTYRSIRYIHYQKVVTIEEKNFICDFMGGVATPIKVPGTFSTTDITLQKALEKDVGYGKEYICISKPEKVPVEKPIVETVESTKEETKEIPEVEPQIVEGIVNAQQARDYLTKTIEEVTYAMVKNKPMVIEVAKKYNVEFPDWEK